MIHFQSLTLLLINELRCRWAGFGPVTLDLGGDPVCFHLRCAAFHHYWQLQSRKLLRGVRVIPSERRCSISLSLCFCFLSHQLTAASSSTSSSSFSSLCSLWVLYTRTFTVSPKWKQTWRESDVLKPPQSVWDVFLLFDRLFGKTDKHWTDCLTTTCLSWLSVCHARVPDRDWSFVQLQHWFPLRCLIIPSSEKSSLQESDPLWINSDLERFLLLLLSLS